MIHFLLVFDHRVGRLVSSDSFVDAEEASQAYSAAEAAHRGSEDLEIVLVGADSLETIHKTHGHYFDESPLASKYLSLS